MHGRPDIHRLVALAGAIAVAAPLALAGSAPSPAHASASQAMSFEAPSELLDDARRDQTLDEIAAFGVRSIRVLVYWEQFAPAPSSRAKPGFDASDPSAYPAGTWDRLDRLVAGARRRGIDPFLTLTGPVPRWATKSGRDNVTEPRTREFADWVTAVGRRYGETVRLWSIWNEPNHPRFLKPQFERGRPTSPRLYRSLFIAGSKALRATPGNERDRILIGETSPGGNSRAVKPLVFVRGMLCLSRRYERSRSCGRLSASGYAHHAYTKAVGPWFKHPDRDNVSIGALSRLTTALARARRAGAIGSLPLYLTEFGIQSHPDRIEGVPVAKQAEYLAIAEWMAYRNPRVQAFSQYLMRDDAALRGVPSVQRYSGFQSGLRYEDGRAKPAYDAFRTPLAAIRRRSRVELWGRVRPQPTRTRIVVQRRSGSSAWRDYRTLTTNSRGVFGARVPYRSSSRYRVKWTAPSGDAFLGPPVRAYAKR